MRNVLYSFYVRERHTLHRCLKDFLQETHFQIIGENVETLEGSGTSAQADDQLLEN